MNPKPVTRGGLRIKGSATCPGPMTSGGIGTTGTVTTGNGTGGTTITGTWTSATTSSTTWVIYSGQPEACKKANGNWSGVFKGRIGVG